MTIPAGKQADERCRSLPKLGGQLLGGIPNEITLDHITPKLPWRVFHVLSLVSPGWLHAIRTRQVYDARVRAHSTERFVLVTHINFGKSKNGIALYSTKDKFCFPLLPPIPHLLKGIPKTSQCVSLDGKVYVLGGLMEPTGDASCKVYVLDLASQRQWKECASMKKPRARFGCGVINGKIYVFGGTSGFKRVYGSEVYDPDENVWSPIRPMTSWRCDHRVESVGEELFVHGGGTCDRINTRDTMIGVKVGKVLEVYHPVKNEWRVVNPFGKDGRELLFVARGKFHSLSKHGIQIQDAEENSWTRLHPVLPIFHPVVGSVCNVVDGIIGGRRYHVSGFCKPFGATVISVQAVHDELLAIVFCHHKDQRGGSYCLIQSKGFGGKTQEITWRKAQFTFFFAGRNSGLDSIQL